MSIIIMKQQRRLRTQSDIVHHGNIGQLSAGSIMTHFRQSSVHPDFVNTLAGAGFFHNLEEAIRKSKATYDASVKGGFLFSQGIGNMFGSSSSVRNADFWNNEAVQKLFGKKQDEPKPKPEGGFLFSQGIGNMFGSGSSVTGNKLDWNKLDWNNPAIQKLFQREPKGAGLKATVHGGKVSAGTLNPKMRHRVDWMGKHMKQGMSMKQASDAYKHQFGSSKRG